jgi:hypothetical protein
MKSAHQKNIMSKEVIKKIMSNRLQLDKNKEHFK